MKMNLPGTPSTNCSPVSAVSPEGETSMFSAPSAITISEYKRSVSLIIISNKQGVKQGNKVGTYEFLAANIIHKNIMVNSTGN